MARIVYEDGLEAFARHIAGAVGGDCVKLDDALESLDVLGGADAIGLVYFKRGKDISDKFIQFARQGLGLVDLSGLGYLFSICVCQGQAKPQYALKVVNRLCSNAGCLPSYSRAVSIDDGPSLDEVCRDLCGEAIRLACGSPFVGLYMRANRKRFGKA